MREEAERKVVAGIRCHQQWLTFFVELWNAAKDRGSSSQSVIFQVCALPLPNNPGPAPVGHRPASAHCKQQWWPACVHACMQACIRLSALLHKPPHHQS